MARPTPVLVSGLTGVDEVAAGGLHSCARLAERVHCWGYGSSGQLGDGSTTFSRVTPVPAWGSVRARALALGYVHSCAIDTGNNLHCWGDNDQGQIGNGVIGTDVVTTPAMVASGIDTVAAGHLHMTATVSGSGLTWGLGVDGQLGDGSMSTRPTPIQVAQLNMGGPLAQVSAGYHHSCARYADHSVWCWGANDHGQLGDGSFSRRLSPTRVFISSVRQITLGDEHTCALLFDGQVRCWGDNDFRQIGDGTAIDRQSPTPVIGL